MPPLIVVSSVLLLLLIACGSIYALFGLLCVARFFRPGAQIGAPPVPDSGHCLPVSILKPVKGLDPSGRNSLTSFCAQDYPCYEVLFGFREPDDPALPMVRELIGRVACQSRITINRKGVGANQKVLNLWGMVDEARYPLLAISDSDMRVDADYLKTVVAESAESEKTGLVTCLYKISAPASTGSALESLAIALDFIPSVLVARRLEGITFGLGASMLISKAALGDIGGLEAISDYLADDYQLGFRLWQRGYKNILSRYVMENRVGSMSLAGHLSHQLRWSRTYRASRPKGFLGYGITHIFPFSLFLVIIRPDWASALILAAVLMIRYGIALLVYRRVIRTREWLRWLFLVPLKDMLSFVIWLASFFGSTVKWRGNTYRILKGGKMVRV